MAPQRSSPLPLGPDGRLLFLTRALRMFSYGFLSVVLVLYLAGLGFSEGRIGLLLTLTLVGDTLISLGITLHADRIGRKRMLVLGAVLMVVAGVPFALSGDFTVLVLAATFGVISPSGNEVGPFLAIEQAALSQLLAEDRRTGVFAWYNLTGSFATALGALAGGWSAQAMQATGVAPVASYRALVFTHIPSNVLLILVPLMPNLPLAIAMLLLRFSISQMDVPTRQAYTMQVVAPDERSAAAGITGIARTTGAAISPVLAAPLLAIPALAGLPFFLAGGLKILYDLLLYRSFKASDPKP